VSSNPSSTDGGSFFVDEVPELGVLGPNYEVLLNRLRNESENLFRSRGENVAAMEIVRSEKPTLRVFH
jgi:hypothetical protein